MENLYSDASNGESENTSNVAMVYRLNKIDEGLQKISKKKSSKKHGKKFKKRLKSLELENEQLKYLLQFVAAQQNMGQEQMNYLIQTLTMHQNAKPEKPTWWQQVLANSIPPSINAIASAFQMSAKSKKNILTDKNQPIFYLTDGNGQK
jgi:hypothetical protein